MKKLTVLLLLSFVLTISTNAIAGNRTIDTTKTSKLAKKVKVKANEVKANAGKEADKAKASASNVKDAAATNVTAAKARVKKTAVDMPNKSADKAIGKDAEGRTIYVGSKGGQYILSPTGKKVYLPKAKRIVIK